MNKRRAVCVVSLMILVGGSLPAADKQDVRDPVLQEVIAAFSPRMPRFVDKHGASLFVGDEPLTRSSLMMALYEYDKSAKTIPAREYATKQELAELRARLALLEKTPGAEPQARAGGYDIVKIINDLEPNMPILLDNSLNSSKVFSKLKSDVQTGRTAVAQEPSAASAPAMLTADNRREISDLSKRLTLMERSLATSTSGGKTEISDLARRIEQIEKTTSAGQGYVVSSGAGDTSFTSELQKLQLQEKRDFARLENRLDTVEDRQKGLSASASTGSKDGVGRTEMARLEKRLNDLEKNVRSGGDSSVGGEASQYSTLLTKVSFGLSMLAALFIAR